MNTLNNGLCNDLSRISESSSDCTLEELNENLTKAFSNNNRNEVIDKLFKSIQRKKYLLKSSFNKNSLK
jgi:hypothetical protein